MRGCGITHKTKRGAEYHWEQGCVDRRLRANQAQGEEGEAHAQEEVEPEVSGGQHGDNILMDEASEDDMGQSEAGSKAVDSEPPSTSESDDNADQLAPPVPPVALEDDEPPMEEQEMMEQLMMPPDADADAQDNDEFMEDPPIAEEEEEDDGHGENLNFSDEEEEEEQEAGRVTATHLLNVRTTSACIPRLLLLSSKLRDWHVNGIFRGAEEAGLGEEERRSLEFYKARLGDPIWPGARMVVIQYCWIRIKEKLRSKTKDTQFDRDSRLMAEYFCPPGNFVPPSYYLVKKLLRTHEAQECERHVCVCGHHAFAKLMPHQYNEHAEQRCPLPDCNELRFDKVFPGPYYARVPFAKVFARLANLCCEAHVLWTNSM